MLICFGGFSDDYFEVGIWCQFDFMVWHGYGIMSLGQAKNYNPLRY